VARHIPALSTYLGHAHVTDTYWYLQATPVVMKQIAEAAKSSPEGKPNGGKRVNKPVEAVKPTTQAPVRLPVQARRRRAPRISPPARPSGRTD